MATEMTERGRGGTNAIEALKQQIGLRLWEYQKGEGNDANGGDKSQHMHRQMSLNTIADLVEIDAATLKDKVDTSENVEPTDEPNWEYALVFDVAQDEVDDKDPTDPEAEKVAITVHPLEYNLEKLGVDSEYATKLAKKARTKIAKAQETDTTPRIKPKKVTVVKQNWFQIETHRMIAACERVGYTVKSYRSSDKKTIVTLLGISELMMKKMAQFRRTDMLINPVEAVKMGKKVKFPLAQQTAIPGEDNSKQKEKAEAMRLMAEDNFEDDEAEHDVSCKKRCKRSCDWMRVLCCGEPTGKVQEDPLPISNWEQMYVQYRRDRDLQKLYQDYPSRDPKPGEDPQAIPRSIFDQRTRLRIMYEGLVGEEEAGAKEARAAGQEPSGRDGCEFTLEEYTLDPNHPLRACFPLPDKSQIRELNEMWVHNWNPLKLMWAPLPQVRSYLGEAPAFYFAFLMTYTRWLMIPALFGVIFGPIQLATKRFGFAGIEVLSLVVVFWSVAFVDFWKRREAALRLDWGMTKYHEKAVARAQFKGDYTIDSVTGEFIETFKTIFLMIRLTFSVSLVSTLLLTAVAAMFGILWVKDTTTNTVAQIGYGVLNGVQISIFDYAYNFLSQYLNDFENHRTQQEYENSLVAKAFFFRFCNSFISLFYISYARPQVVKASQNKHLGPQTTMDTLRLQLVTLFLTAIVIQNTIEVLFPIIWEYACVRMATTDDDGLDDDTGKPIYLSPAEKMSRRLPYVDTLQDMSEMVIQYGYVTLFVVAFPFTPVLAVLNNVIEMKVDASNLVNGVQRPHLRGAYGLGAWNIILGVVGIVAVINNVGIYTYLTCRVDQMFYPNAPLIDPIASDCVRAPNAFKALFFVIVSAILVVIVAIEKALIRDEPDFVTKGIERQRNIENVLVLRARLTSEIDGDDFADKNAGDGFSDGIKVKFLNTFASDFPNDVSVTGDLGASE